ncbi:hypothetical protein KUD11_14190 [Roseovarius sp. LXJ103]|uniref:hypothetical protein n=1 Tax=Roseovarius carneus TaxID=2853164 RepID=UPI000D605090|nr:hypothetical protein [Roseovarius carneus]MBZ8119787.1 hypothetical protein [Roseovarius carneus]PWE34613.1 hypothetical protein DD563_00550 [Pelagicola sp. LXJ1103]
MPYLLLAITLIFAASPWFVPDFGGFDAGQFPIPQDNPPVQPAGYAFAIWGVIYLWLIVGAAFGARRRFNAPEWAALRAPLLVSVGIGAAWLPVAVMSPVWASALIWLMWAGAVMALLRTPVTDRMWARGPIGLYAGWLTAASCVSIGLMTAGYGVLPQVPAALLSITIALILALLIQRQRPDAPTFPAAVIWALIGVCVANIGGSVAVLALAATGAATLMFTMVQNIKNGH